MPAAGTAQYVVSAAATANVPSTTSATNGGFTPYALPTPTIDSLGTLNGQYFLLTAQVNQTQNGIWYNDANGPVPIMTVGAGGAPLDPEVEVVVEAGGAQNAGTQWVYTAVSHNGGPGFAQI